MMENVLRAVAATGCFAVAVVFFAFQKLIWERIWGVGNPNAGNPNLVVVTMFLLFGAVFVVMGLGCLIKPTPKTELLAEPEPKQHDCPGWFLPAGIVATILGLLAFVSSFVYGGGGTLAGGLVAGLLNPIFFVGFPLGIYWLRRYGERPATSHPASSSTTLSPGESNPKLTHCPDCGLHVSRLASACPHCGRPLTPEIEPRSD
jgi:hypothetical protein